MMSGTSDGGASFTALLDMPADQAVEILHNCGDESAGWRRNDWGLKVSIDYCRPKNQFLDFSPPLPSNLGFVDRSVRQSLLSAACGEDSPETTSILSNSSGNSFIVKSEPLDSESNPSSSSHPADKSTSPMSAKRKDRERKVKESTKKSRSSSKDSSGDAEKLPYVHVRARRGQATDSHSLAERARREKINARMKLLQGLVPGCSKISGTALVLDEIINHVQSLQRQVEFLSMRLAAINPSADFTLDSLLVSNSGAQTTAESGGNICNMLMPIMWQGMECGGDRDGRQVQPWQVENQHLLWERGVDDGNHLLSSLYRVDDVTNSGMYVGDNGETIYCQW